jgi:hypothetical protein
MTHTNIQHRAAAILTVAAALALALSAATAPASARTFYFTPAGTMVQQPLPAEWACLLQRASAGKAQSMRCRATTSAAHASSGRFGPNASDSASNAASLAHDPTTRSVAAAGAGYGYGDTPIASSGSHPPRSQVVYGRGHGNPNAPATVVRVVAPNHGFDWGDAGIGAASSLALAMIGLGGALAISQTRARSSTT